MSSTQTARISDTTMGFIEYTHIEYGINKIAVVKYSLIIFKFGDNS